MTTVRRRKGGDQMKVLECPDCNSKAMNIYMNEKEDKIIVIKCASCHLNVMWPKDTNPE